MFVLTLKEESLYRGENGCLEMQRRSELFLFFSSSEICIYRQMATLGKLKCMDHCIFSFYPPFMCTMHCLYMATTSVRSKLHELCEGHVIIKSPDHPVRHHSFVSLAAFQCWSISVLCA